jgi:putative FmdB family regulatory protein
MPIYEYRCNACGAQVEKRQSINDDPLTTCEKCGGALEKQWSLSGFQFKGAGWYVTDYSRNKNSGEKSEKGSGGQSTDKADGASKPSSEPAPAAKKESSSKKD